MSVVMTRCDHPGCERPSWAVVTRDGHLDFDGQTHDCCAIHAPRVSPKAYPAGMSDQRLADIKRQYASEIFFPTAASELMDEVDRLRRIVEQVAARCDERVAEILDAMPPTAQLPESATVSIKAIREALSEGETW